MFFFYYPQNVYTFPFHASTLDEIFVHCGRRSLNIVLVCTQPRLYAALRLHCQLHGLVGKVRIECVGLLLLLTLFGRPIGADRTTTIVVTPFGVRLHFGQTFGTLGIGQFGGRSYALLLLR